MSLCFYSIKAKLFNKSCRELENEGIKDFTFEQLKNKMSHQGNGNYYKQLINYKGMDLLSKDSMITNINDVESILASKYNSLIAFNMKIT